MKDKEKLPNIVSFVDVVFPYGIVRYKHTDYWYFINRYMCRLGSLNRIIEPQRDCFQVKESKMFSLIDKLTERGYVERLEDSDCWVFPFHPKIFDGLENIKKSNYEYMVSHYISTLKFIFKQNANMLVNDGYLGQPVSHICLPYHFVIRDSHIAVSQREYCALGESFDYHGKQDYEFMEICDDSLIKDIGDVFTDDFLVRGNDKLYYCYTNREKCEPYVYSYGYYHLLKKFIARCLFHNHKVKAL